MGKTETLQLHPDRFFPSDKAARKIARVLFEHIQSMPIISPHGHVDPGWFAKNDPFEDPVSCFLWPDHYVVRLLYSQGITLEQLGCSSSPPPDQAHRREIWRIFATLYPRFLGMPSRIWLDHVFSTVFGLKQQLTGDTADYYYDAISEALAAPSFRPRALFDQFNIEALATTEAALASHCYHQAIATSGWNGRIISTFRPDDVIDPEQDGFAGKLDQLGALTGHSTEGWDGYLAALVARRQQFRTDGGATATDHGHATANTADLPLRECRLLFERVRSGKASPEDAELFRAQMLTEMAAMSCADGMTMQLHPGVWRNHNPSLFARYGRDIGADIPVRAEYTDALKPLLDRFGNRSKLCLILFTLDESTYARELAPLAGHYPCLKLGPAWWFHDSPEGMLRFRRQTLESSGFYNSVGFNDDTRAFFSIPARHDLARRMDCNFLAELVASHRLDLEQAKIIAMDMTYNLPKDAYKI